MPKPTARAAIAATLRDIAAECEADAEIAEAASTLRKVANAIDGTQRISVDLRTNIALVNGRDIQLSPMTARLLAALIPFGFRDYKKLDFDLWGRQLNGGPLTTNDCVKQCVFRLRAKLQGTGFEIVCHHTRGLELVYHGHATIPH